MTARAKPTLGRALLLPSVLALGLGWLLARPASVTAPGVRPPLLTPMVLDELVPSRPVPAASERPASPRTQEGFRSLRGE